LNNEPTEPTEPSEPSEPDRPVEPTTPVEPDAPATPVEPAAPTTPYEPAVPAVPLPPTSVDAGTPGPPTGPPAGPPAPPRKGLPGWAWALIIGAAVVMIAVIVVVVIVVNSVLGAVAGDNSAAEPTAVPTAAGTESAPATEAATPSATPTAKPTKAADAGSGTAISLDEHVEFGTPYWQFPIEDGWVMAPYIAEGVSQADNAELGCKFTTNQVTKPAADLAATGDGSDTESALVILEQQFLAEMPTAEVVGSHGSTSIAITMPAGSDGMEFATSRVDYTVSGVDVANEFAARAIPQSDAFLYYNVSCPTAVIDAGNSPFEQLTEELAVVFE
jgi:hypothetical protein